MFSISLERDYIYLCEYGPRIVSIVSQPEKVTIWIDGTSHQYTPDYRVVYADGEIRIAEVKPDEKYADPEMRKCCVMPLGKVLRGLVTWALIRPFTEYN